MGAYLARLDVALDAEVDALSGVSAPTISPNFGVTVPDGADPGTLLDVQQPDGQIVQVEVPAGCPPGTTFAVPTRPFSSSGALPLNVMVYHVSVLDHDWIVFETPPVLPVSGAEPSSGVVVPNPCGLALSPSYSRPACCIAHFYDQSRCAAEPNGMAIGASGRLPDFSRTLEIVHAGRFEPIPEATLWLPDTPLQGTEPVVAATDRRR